MEKQEFSIKNKIEELDKVVQVLDEIAEKWDVNPKHIMQINLALEEVLTNIVHYAFPDGGEHEILIVFSKSDEELRIEVEDDGFEFDMSQTSDPNMELPVEERQVGGLGLYLVKSLMDEIGYERKNNKNHFIFSKKL